MTTAIKICGITSLFDARAACAAGANFIGLIFVPESPRNVAPEAAKAICGGLRGRVKTVGVFRNAPSAIVTEIARYAGVDFVQFHGGESPEDCKAAPRPVIKAMEITPFLTPSDVSRYAGCVRYILFDRPKGETSPQWLSYAKTFLTNAKIDIPYFFAGGLTPETVADAIAGAFLFGVDVASGVEASPGRKDLEKLMAFCKAIKKEPVS